MDERRFCSICGAILSEENEHVFADELLCTTCLDDNTTLCDNCGRRIWRDDAEGDGTITLCGSCYDNHYTTCENCGRWIHYDDACYEDGDDYPYCQDCYNRRNSNAIHSYNYKPKSIFYGEGNLFMGVELEIDKGGEDSDKAQELLDIANACETRIYCKHDGSLERGFELVSHPMTLEYHRKEMCWQEITEAAKSSGFRSHDTESCGLHIHCNKDAFGDTIEDREAAIGRFVFFVEKMWWELVRFSRRKEENLNRWAARYATISNTPKETYTKAKGKCMGRYVAVNLLNYETIEIRMFRGTLRHLTFIATLQLVAHLCELAIKLNDDDFERMTWSEFVMSIDKDEMPELIEYLKSKRLYVNEFTETNEED